jgi:uncharacterized protein (TIGR01619 family)
MTDGWNFYMCNVNDALASIAVDLNLRKNAPDTARPELIWVWVHFKHPRPDGLSSPAEFDILIEIEERITEALAPKFDAILSGRITTDGRREFYYYASRSDQCETVLRSAFERFPSYEFDFGTQTDEAWNHYLDVMYPSEEDRQKMENRSVLDALQKNGDNLQTPRDVSHWIYFRNAGDRDAFWAAIQPREYRLDSQNENPDKEFPYGICVMRFQSVQQDDIDSAVLELLEQAKELRGDYDGWETQVIST